MRSEAAVYPYSTMSDSVAAARLLRENLSEHPAAVAWTRATGEPEPTEIRVFRDRKGQALGNAAIYWLGGATSDGGAVIAKLNRRSPVEVEHTVYHDVLPRLPVPSIRCLGRVDEDAELSWLFLECAEGDRYSPALARHRETAGRWLGALHAGASSLSDAVVLPERGFAQFLDRARSAKAVFGARAEHSSTSAEVRAVLEAAISELSRLEERWDELTGACRELPRTLVHGDFAPPNLRLGSGPGTPRLLAFDWEEAGWGSPAVDLARVPDSRLRFAANPCLESYRQAAMEHGVAPPLDALCSLAEVGRVLRCLSAIHWLSMELGDGDPRLADADSRPVLKLQAYLSWLAGPERRKRQPTPSQGEAKLRRLLESEVLPKVSGPRRSIADLRSAPSSSATSYAAQVVTVRLTDGATMRMFLKDFGSSRLFKEEASDRRARELHVYRDLLPDGELDIPAYYGAVWGQEHKRFWMVVEFVDGVPVADCEFDSWPEATAWLARMQGLYACDPGRFERSSLLIRHDADFFASRAERALSSARRISSRATRRLRRILSGYDDFVALMADQPSTFVHGSYRPENVLIDEPSRPSRVCVVDWERAAIGAPLYDLARFCDGYHGARLDRLLDSYGREATAHGVPVLDRERMVEVLDCFSLHRVVNAISHALEKGRTQRQVSSWLGYGETVRARLP
jgi:aminoglycoside phosphotransferase (APT) family kinase protein